MSTQASTRQKMFKVRVVDEYRGTETDAGLYFLPWNMALHGTRGSKRGVLYAASALKHLPGLSKSVLKQIDSARVGTKIKVTRISSSSHLCFIRVSSDELAEYAYLQSLKDELAQVEEDIRQSIPLTLVKRKQELERMIKDCMK